MTGSIAGFPGPDITRGIPYVPNLTHNVSDYISVFLDAGPRSRNASNHR